MSPSPVLGGGKKPAVNRAGDASHDAKAVYSLPHPSQISPCLPSSPPPRELVEG